MVKLPDDYMDYIRVIPSRKMLVLHFKNRGGQYFSYYQTYTEKKDIPRALEVLKSIDTSQEDPYIINSDKTCERVKATDHKWKPVSFPSTTFPLKNYYAINT